MPVIRSLSTALPPYEIQQAEARQFAYTHFAASFPNIERYLPVFTHAEIDTRYIVVPSEWFLTPHSFKECNDLFIQWALQLGEEAAQNCLEQVGLTPRDIDHLVLVSTTGLATPSIDARLINRLGMGTHTRRTPVWGLGCAGGVAGLSRAYEYARGFPGHRVLLVCIELCSVTFQWQDLSKRNVIASAIFSDGAAALLVEGDDVAPPPTNADRPAPRILGTQSTLWPDTLNIMGWDIIDTGMQVVFSSRIPFIVQDLMHENVSEFLAPYNLHIDDISQFILHPGGAKVIRAYEQALQIDPERLSNVRQVLRQHGNMSSPTVFFVYETFYNQQPLQPGEYGLMVVLGPGFSSEMALIQG